MTRRAFSDAEAAAHATGVPEWRLEAGRLTRRFVCDDFRAALKLANRIGMVAEERDHHPDLHLTDYRVLAVVLLTHDAGGLTAADFDLARRIDQLVTG